MLLQGFANQLCLLICLQTLWDSGYLHVDCMTPASLSLSVISVALVDGGCLGVICTCMVSPLRFLSDGYVGISLAFPRPVARGAVCTAVCPGTIVPAK